jgi:hypothetical protein
MHHSRGVHKQTKDYTEMLIDWRCSEAMPSYSRND